MVFGYLNRNYEEELDILVGPANSIEGGAGTSSWHIQWPGQPHRTSTPDASASCFA